MEDPAGLRRPELSASGIERREEQHFKAMEEIGSKRGRERGQPWGKEQSELCAQGVPPPPLFIGGGEGGQSWRRRQPLGGRPRVSSLGGGALGFPLRGPWPSKWGAPPMGPLGPSGSLPLGPSK